HADADQLVELAELVGITIVEQAHFATGRESSIADSFLRQLKLMLAQRDPRRLRSIVLGGVHNQSAPSAADIEQALARLQPELAANVVELLLLSRLHSVIRRLEICAGIHHRPIKP